MQTSSRKLLVVLAGLMLAGILVYQSTGFIHKANFSGQELLHAVAGADRSLLLLSVALIYVCYAFRALRWQLFQGHLGSSRFWIIYNMTLAGFTAIFVLGRPGEPVRPLLLARKEKLPIADMFGIYALERLFDFGATAVIGALALVLYQSHGYQVGLTSELGAWVRKAGVVLLTAVGGGILGLAYLRLYGSAELERRLQNPLETPGWRGSLARILLGFVRGVQAIRTWGELLLALAYSTAHWFLVLLVYYWGSRAFGGRLGTLSLGDVMLVMAFSLVGSVVQLPAVGGGAQLASYLVYTKIFEVQPEPATAAAIVIWLIGFAMCSFAGVPLLIREGLSLGKLRELAQERDAGDATAQ
jgi:glycosyltransferase 2 family protein